jgi:dipeptidyl aminopeptidase/acylaminoacyl peptidase
MKKRLLTLAALLVVTLAADAAPGRFISEKDLFRFTWIGDPQLSPDGSEVAWVRVTVDEKKDAYATSIWSVGSQPGALPRQITNGPRDTAPRWSHDGKMLAFLRSLEKDGKPQPAQIYILRLDGGEPRPLTSMARAVESMAWSPAGNTIAFTARTKPDDLLDKKERKDEEHDSDVRVINQATYRSNGSGYRDPSRAAHIWMIDLGENAKPKQLTSGDFSEEDVTWSPDGALIYFTSTREYEPYYDVRGNVLYSVPPAGGAITKVAGYDGSINSFSLSPDGKWAAFAGSLSHPIQSHTESDLMVVSTAPGSTPRNLTKGYDYEVMGGVGGDQGAPRAGGGPRPVWSDDGRSILIVSGEEGRANIKRVDLASGAVAAVTNGNQAVTTFRSAGGRTVAVISTPTMIGDLYLIGPNGEQTRLTDVNAKLWSELTITEPEELWYTSFDGTKIETWIQRPPDFDPSKKYPMILNIHGGPHAAYGYVFDHEFQWMAAKGYVVVYPNPRGSTTYGEKFANVIQFHYPGDDFKDLVAGVDAVVAKGYVDPKKLGVTGGSGGGLLTNWTITQTQRFAAAVAQRDIADWATFWYTADFTLFQPTWFHKAPWEDAADFRARSPITYIERVTTPLMLIEGEADYRTPPAAGGEMMFRALKYRHVPTVMVRFPEESHELSRSGKPWHRVERLEHIVGWFDHWLQNVPKPEYEQDLRPGSAAAAIEK